VLSNLEQSHLLGYRHFSLLMGGVGPAVETRAAPFAHGGDVACSVLFYHCCAVDLNYLISARQAISPVYDLLRSVLRWTCGTACRGGTTAGPPRTAQVPACLRYPLR
jgi:hypothetical protein